MIGRLHATAGKHPHAAHERQSGGALGQQHLQARLGLAQQHDRGGRRIIDSSRLRRSGQLDELLAEVLALQQSDERGGRGGEALRDRFAVADRAGRYSAQVRERLGQQSRWSEMMKPRTDSRMTSSARTLWIEMSLPS